MQILTFVKKQRKCKNEGYLSKQKNYKTSQCVRNLGIILDSQINFIPQI